MPDAPDALLKISAAALLGGLIGFERDKHGLRTHLLVCMGAAVFTIISDHVARQATVAGYFADPGRIAALAAGVALISLVLLKAVERRYSKDSYRVLTVTTSIEVSASEIIALIKRPNLTVLSCEIDRDYATRRAVTRLSIRLYHRGITDKPAHGIIDSLEKSPVEINNVSWSTGSARGADTLADDGGLAERHREHDATVAAVAEKLAPTSATTWERGSSSASSWRR